jgi:DNA polymerase-3 subunit gamma/tau
VADTILINMSHVLANRWRPQALNEVIGQKHAVAALTNALNHQQLHHSYLFTGTRGVGKTSLARLFAQGLNCIEGISATPCKTCDACKGVIQGADLDFYEIDAASRTKVEETLKILEMAHYPPTRSKFKIFLIDEVHMLSNHSFNALLKTLEQPPKNIIFLLATTEPMRIPDTVRSRCLQFALSPVDGSIISDHLAYVTTQEKRSIDQAALDLLVDVAHGSVRDAMTALQQVMLQSTKNPIDIATTQQALGLVSNTTFQALYDALINQETEEVAQLTRTLTMHLQQKNGVIDQWLSFLSQKIWCAKDPANIQNWIQIGLLAKRDLALYPNVAMAFEVMLARTRYCVPQATKNWLADEVAKPHSFEIPKVDVEVNQSSKRVQAQPVQTHDKKTADQGNKPQTLDLENWAAIVKNIGLSGMVNQLAQHVSFDQYIDNTLNLKLINAKASLLNERNLSAFEKKLQDRFPGLKLIITLVDNEAPDHDTAYKQVEKANKVQVTQTNATIHENEDVKRIQSLLSADIIDHKEK